jgi:hypothetical protein
MGVACLLYRTAHHSTHKHIRTHPHTQNTRTTDNGDFELAAKTCSWLLRDNKALWDTWVGCFAQKYQLHHIAPFLPIAHPQLDAVNYELVLNQVSVCVCVFVCVYVSV